MMKKISYKSFSETFRVFFTPDFIYTELFQQLEQFFDGWRPVMSKNSDLINIGECTGNCNAVNSDYRLQT